MRKSPLRRGLGLLLAGLSLIPVFALLDRPQTGAPGAQTLSLAWSQLHSSWWGGLMVVGAGLALATLLPMDRVRRGLRRWGSVLARPGSWPFALVLGVVSGLLAFVASRALFAGLPSLEDGMASLVHARYLAAGHTAGPLVEPGAGWLIPNTLTTPEGWISQYPPLHLLLLAAGLWIGAPWLVGPVLLAVTVALSARIADLVLVERPSTARTGAILVALSPFLIFLGGGYLSHTSAAAFGALALYAALKTERHPILVWPLLTGLAAGGAVASRPWTGLALGVVLPAGLWIARPGRKAAHGPAASRVRELGRRLLGATAGGLPVAAALGAYNQHFFGHPLRFGYTAAYGGAHLPGFHRDPWGNLYGLSEAVGYTGADLVSLGVHLLETPLSAVLVVGVGLLAAKEVPRGSGVLLAWALLPVAANALYWHHGFHMGPRMLYEAAPAWCLLLAVTALELVRVVPDRFRDPAPSPGGEPDPGASSDRGGGWRRSLRFRGRDTLLVAFLLCVPAAGLLALQRARSYAWPAETLARVQAPELPVGARSVVFVHGSWTERISARLQSAGMAADSLETAFRRNDVCALHRYALWRADESATGPDDPAADADPPSLDLRSLPGRPDSMEPVEVTPGYVVWRDPERSWSPECRRQLAADRRGVVSLAPLLWQGDLPGIEEGAPLFVRDLGPEENGRIRAAFRERTPWVYAPPKPDAPPRLLPYGEGMRALW